MDNQAFNLFIDRLSRAFAIQAVQIRVLQSFAADFGANQDEMAERQKDQMMRSYDQDVQFFRRHLAGEFSGQRRTDQEERKLLDEWWSFGQKPPSPPEGLEEEGH